MKAPCEKRSVIRPTRFTPKQDALLRKYAEIMTIELGRKITISWVIHMMLEMGKRPFENEFISVDYSEGLDKSVKGD